MTTPSVFKDGASRQRPNLVDRLALRLIGRETTFWEFAVLGFGGYFGLTVLCAWLLYPYDAGYRHGRAEGQRAGYVVSARVP